MLTFILSIAGAITGISAAIGVLWIIFGWGKKIVEGQKCQLRSEMLRIYYRNHETETIRQYELENFLLCYAAYRALGGNSFMEKVEKDVIKWEVIN